MEKLFETWTYERMRFLAFPEGRGVAIVNEHGDYYGAWFDACSFRAQQRAGTEAALVPLGKVRLQHSMLPKDL